MGNEKTLRIKLPIRCNLFGHNHKGLLYTQAGNPNKKIKVWVGYYCTRCGLIVQHTNYKRKRNFDYGFY